jgi:phosphotransferase system HPr-like phosphotransfer protein
MVYQVIHEPPAKNYSTVDSEQEALTRLRRVFRVDAENGLTMLKYSQLIQYISDYVGQIRISNGAIWVDGRSMIELLQLKAVLGTILTVELIGRNAHQVMEKIEMIFAA